ncbi:MAG: hypothetical protein GF383_04320 [Candidatus Lokiarchaeota archaeon]|nr:hypothetical protein [Candidatus Lokiarchaeota archaeon]MBD3338985.1 hypothetical protein [Candidatus Lokiarchaeota archaeon]
MLFQQELNPFLHFLTDVIAFIIEFLKPIIIPIGEWMVLWIGFLLAFFPDNNLTIYIIIFVVLVVSGVIINIKYPGDEIL